MLPLDCAFSCRQIVRPNRQEFRQCQIYGKCGIWRFSVATLWRYLGNLRPNWLYEIWPASSQRRTGRDAGFSAIWDAELGGGVRVDQQNCLPIANGTVWKCADHPTDQRGTHMSCPNYTTCPMPGAYGRPEFCPANAVEGHSDSPIWIVALNPKTQEEDHVDDQPNPITWTNTNPRAPHFVRLKGILGPWYESLFQSKGVAHTDIVKCGSPGFTSLEANAVQFCKAFFLAQIRKHKPKLLLVLSSEAARIIAKEAKLCDEKTEGSWKFDIESDPCYVVLSGYSAPRQERYAKLRLRRDFLAACERSNLTPPNSTV